MESFPAFSGRTGSRDLICIRHTYQNDKICKPIGLFKSYDNRTKALENRPPPEFLGGKTDGPIHRIHKWRPRGTAWFRIHGSEAW